ncbi:MAG: ribonuclease Y [Epsilonproteobacteria bacterium]|nr:MAG: ribonuclease Y [Campylobacterota bacterium]
MEQLIIPAFTAVVGSLITFLIVKKINSATFNIHIEQAKAKAKVIEHEAQTLLKETKAQVKLDLEKVTNNDKEVETLKNGLEAQVKEYKDKTKEAIKILENSSGLTKEEAKDLILKKVKEDSRSQVASIFRKEYKQAQKDSKVEINNILSHAVTRYAGEFAAERLTNNLKLKDEESKGKIIGKEGRNIKTLEMTTGVDIIIGDIPNTIVISSFNLYRRAIATKTLEVLIADGRIQPARIEEVYASVKKEFDNNIYKEGEDTIRELGIKKMHPELISLVGKLRYRASYGQNALAHTLEVANLSGLIASQLGGDTVLARRAGLLHDIGKALTHDVKGSHVDIGADMCKKFNEPEEVINAIYAHHGHEEATSIESAAVCAADALSAARPGARREVLQSFLKRVEEIEAISTAKAGVTKAFAINAGREIRVIVNAKLVNDDESILLATEIAQEIENKVQYPGEIKVNVIREVRSMGYAR